MPSNNQYGDRILRFLENEYPVPQRAKHIASRLRMSYGYCRQILSLMARQDPPLIVSSKDGYSLPSSAKPVSQDIRLENLHLTSKSNIEQVRSAVGVTPVKGVNKRFPGSPRFFEHWFKSWKVTVQEFQNGTITVKLAANGGVGLSFLDFVEWAGWLQGIYPTIPKVLWVASNWEWHKDHDGFRVEGAKAITLQVFENVWFKLYNKPDRLRTEMRVATSIPLDTAVQLFARVTEEFAKYGVMIVREVRTA